jgi:ABC-type multidrug transport system permease subunit
MTSPTATERSVFRPSGSLRTGAIAAFVRRDFAIARSYRLAFLLDACYGLLQVAIYFFISRTFEGATATSLEGAPSYFAFAAVGLILGLVVDAASEGIAYRIREEQLSGSLEALVTQPVRALELCLGMVGFPFLFAMTRAVAYLLIAGLWMDLDLARTSFVGLLVVLVTTSTAVAALGIVSAAVVLVLKRGEIVAGMVLFAMTLLAGSVFPISELPGWLEPLGRIVPLRFAFDGARDALFTGTGWVPDAAVLLLFSAAALPLAVWMFGRALTIARRAGTMAQY